MIREVIRNNRYAIYGRILRKEREEGCYIGNDITRKTGLSKQLISDIEIGNKNVSFEKIRIYASFFDIIFDETENKRRSEEMNKVFFDALDCLIYDDSESFVRMFHFIKKGKEEFIHSKCADIFYLFEMIESLICQDKNRFQKIRTIIDKYFLDIYDGQLSFIYWMTIGNYYNMTKRYEEGLQVFRKIREGGTSISSDLQAMLYYGLGTSYRYIGNPVSSMTAYQKAKALFDETNNYLRSLYISAYMGKNMVSLYRYEEAALLYENLMKTALLLDDKKMIEQLRVSMAENYFHQADYSRAIDATENWFNETQAYDMCIIRLWSAYKLNNDSLCRKTLEMLTENKSQLDDYGLCMTRCMQALLKKEDELIIDALMELNEIMERKHLYDIQEFMLEILIDALKRQERYYEAVKYYECQIRILRRKMNDMEHLEADFNYAIAL